MSVFDEAWDFRLDLTESENKMLCDFKANVCHISKQISNQLEEFQVQNLNYSGSATRNSDDELKIITERNKQLAQEIKVKVEDYERQQVQYGNFKSDQKRLAKEIKDTHEAFLMAKKYYKKYLKIYFTVEARNDGKQEIFLQFFTEVKKESKEYSVQLLKDTNTKLYEVLQIIPSLDIFKEVQQKLQITNDVPGALCYIRQAFLKNKKASKEIL